MRTVAFTTSSQILLSRGVASPYSEPTSPTLSPAAPLISIFETDSIRLMTLGSPARTIGVRYVRSTTAVPDSSTTILRLSISSETLVSSNPTTPVHLNATENIQSVATAYNPSTPLTSGAAPRSSQSKNELYQQRQQFSRHDTKLHKISLAMVTRYLGAAHTIKRSNQSSWKNALHCRNTQQTDITALDSTTGWTYVHRL